MPVLRIGDAREHSGDRRLLLLDMGMQLPVDVRDEGLAHVLQLRVLRRDVCIVKRTQPSAPRIEDELLSLCFVEGSKEGDAVEASVAYVRGDLVGRVDKGDFELSGAIMESCSSWCVAIASSVPATGRPFSRPSGL
ncbi:hypothetical protein BON30_24190 [Cystobacter ferrugineus]|uniref:Uncharacterized protein n=1 Tax=Cystobacter ferrugineus TaxID=83449 RepID=A0A1L9B7L1_9BACT|nr:hypothetical protein BON30_24190 [Cystobacter ferrugineus]